MSRLLLLSLLAGLLYPMLLRADVPGTDWISARPQAPDTAISALPASAPPVATLPSVNDVFSPVTESRVSFSEMGQPQGVTLSGGQIEAGVSFTLPDDVLATGARLVLKVRASADFSSRQSSLLLMINGQSLGSVSLNSAAAETAVFQLEIPPELFVSQNSLSFRISDGETLQCERRERYRIALLPDSYISIDSRELNTVADLSRFPRPFFDTGLMGTSVVSMTFPQKIQPGQISAATTLASWLGTQSGYRRLMFTVSENRLPEKHGIIFGMPGEEIGGLTLPAVQGPALQIIDNPGNPVFKLLLVTGRDDEEWRQAVWRLVKGNFAAQDKQFSVIPQIIPVRKPYDAPRWINTSRRVYFSELMSGDGSLTATGLWHPPITLSFRAAPDLFLWDGQAIPLHIEYRFPSETWIDEKRSWLNTTFNSTFLFNLPVNKSGLVENLWHLAGGDIRQESVDLPLEPYLIYGDNQLALYFSVVAKADAPCSALRSNNLRSTVGEHSWIDLSKTRHFTLLPELSYFIGASFPFSRQADFSRSVLMLPASPSETEIAVLLELAGRAGNATGVAIPNNRVMLGWPQKAAESALLRERDVLVVSSLDRKPWFELSETPFVNDGQGLRLRPGTYWSTLVRWLTGDWNTRITDADRYLSSSNAWRGFISFPSPWNGERVVVKALASSDEQLALIGQDLSTATVNAGIRGDLAIITDETGVRSFRVGTQFPSGEMPWYLLLAWYAGQHVVILALAGVLAGVLTGGALYMWLCKRAPRRLSPRGRRK